jgi:uncharacterized protein (DUF58 family)
MLTAERVLQRLEWEVMRPLDGLLQGDYRSLFLGAGLDLAGIREYQAGDDIRYMDWNVTARLTIPHVREYAEDREINAWFLLDVSPSMDFGSVETSKRQTIVDFVGLMAGLLTRRGNRVGALIYTGKVERMVPCRTGRVHVLRLINDLLKLPALPNAPFTELSVLLNAARGVIRHRSLIFFLSDFASAPGWERSLRILSTHNDIVGVRIWDLAEEELPDVGPLYLEDSETGEQVYVDTRDKRFRLRFADLRKQHLDHLKSAFRAAQADLFELSTEDDLVRAIVRFNSLRRQRRRRSSLPARVA